MIAAIYSSATSHNQTSERNYVIKKLRDTATGYDSWYVGIQNGRLLHPVCAGILVSPTPMLT